MRVGTSRRTFMNASAVALKRAMSVVGVALCCFAGTTQTTQQDYKEMRGMLSQYSWKASADRNGSDSQDGISRKITNLIDLDEVSVGIFLNEQASKLLDKQTLEALIKNRLRSMGIKLREYSFGCIESVLLNMTDYERLLCEDKSWSRIEFVVEMGDGELQWFYTCRLVVHRAAYIRPGYFTSVPVWTRGGYGIVGKRVSQSEIREDFRNALRDFLDKFEADWRLANEK